MQIRSALSACHAVVAVSAAIAERLEEIGVPGERIRVIYNGVDPERFLPMAQHESRQALSLPEEGRLILFVGNLLVSKGCLDLLEAWKRVRERFPEVRIAFVGDGPARAEIEAFSHTVADASAIRLAGRVNHSSLARWMNAADLVCLPSHAEGVPNVLLEAMACGRPIVATHVGGVPEVVPELAGILTPAHDIAALSHAIVVALDRRWRGDLILEHARRFSWEANVDELCETMFGAAHG